ncbi:MAG TPA: DUF3841 domain-containing protein [Clostridia bacterium]|nr:DUF3841 domain-containing protein [Clostridia bacterium]
MENSTASSKVRLWTRQHQNVLQELRANGVYKVRREYLLQKFDSISDYYLSIYRWYAERAERIVPRPEGAEFPVWLSASSDMMLQPIENNVIIELEADIENVVFTDSEKWGYVVNYWYLPIDKEDERKFNEELKKMGIGDESELYMGHKGNFYPQLRSRIIKSWERLFEDHPRITPTTQATLWEIRKEWVTNVISTS